MKLKERSARIIRIENVPFLIISIGILLRLVPYLFNRSLWFDESVLALNIIKRPLLGLLLPLDYSQVAPFGFLIVVKLLVQVFGNSEYILRLFPFITGSISIILFYQLSKYIINRQAVIISLGLFSLSGLLIYYSSELKPYSVDLLTALLLYLITIYVQFKGLTKLSIALFGTIGAGLIWFSHSSTFVLAGIGITLSIFCIIKGEWVKFNKLLIVYSMWIFSLTILLIVGLLDNSVKNTDPTFWTGDFMPFPPLSLSEVKWFFSKFFEFFNHTTGKHLYGIAVLSFSIGCISLFNRNKEWFFILISPFLITLLISGFHLYPIKTRLLLFIVPSMMLFIAEGAEKILYKTKHNLSILGIILIGLLFFDPIYNAGNNLTKPGMSREEVKPIMKYVKEHRKKGDAIYLYYASKHAFEYYASRYGFERDQYIIGVKSRNTLNNYVEDLNQLRGKKRLWIIFSHYYKRSGVDEELFFLYHLDSFGKKLLHVKAHGASVYLYEM